ncbi:diguanylate cyclase domain-containing protein [Nocardia sp. NPDC003183]
MLSVRPVRRVITKPHYIRQGFATFLRIGCSAPVILAAQEGSVVPVPTLARAWASRIADLAAAPPAPEHLAADLCAVLECLVDALRGPRLDLAGAERAGIAVAGLGFSDPAVVAQSIPILQTLCTHCETATADFGVLAGGFGCGYGRTAATLQQRGAAEGIEAAFRHAGIAISIGDGDGRILDVNPAFEKITGYRLDELRGRNGFELAGEGAPEIRRQVMAELSERQSTRFEGEFARPDGSAGWITWTVTRCETPNGDKEFILGVAEDTTEYHLTTQQLQWQAYHDPLTHLPNRRYLLDRMRELLADDSIERPQLVCALDIDEFKQINDTYGHDTGDRLLIEIAHRLQTCLQPSDFLARYGGDEFIAILGHTDDPHHGSRILSRLHAVSDTGFAVQDGPIGFSFSIGAVSVAGAGVTPEQLLTAADQQLYAAKAMGRNRVILRSDPVAPATDE